VTNRPLALHADEPRSEVEDEVIWPIVKRSRNANAQLKRSKRYGRLSDGAFLVGREHDRILGFLIGQQL
jgi:hypothetical protein